MLEESQIINATKQLIIDVLKSDEFKEVKETIRGLQSLNLKAKPESHFFITVGGKLVDEAQNIADLIGRDWLQDFTDLIDDLGVDYFARLYDISEWESVYDVYEKEDFRLIDRVYKKLSENGFYEVKVKANPYEDVNKQGLHDRTFMIMDFKTAEEYAQYLTLEGLQNLRIELEAGWDEDEFDDYEQSDEPWMYDE